MQYSLCDSSRLHATYPALFTCLPSPPPPTVFVRSGRLFPLFAAFNAIASSSSHCISMPGRPGLASDLFKLGQQLLALRGNDHAWFGKNSESIRTANGGGCTRSIGSVADNILFPLFLQHGVNAATKNELRSQANILCCLRFSREFECFSSGLFLCLSCILFFFFW